MRALDKDSGYQGSNPLTFGNLDPDNIVSVYWASGRRRGQGRDAKGQGYGGRECRMVSDLFQVVALFGLGEGEEDLGEGGVKDVHGKLLQVAVEGVGDEEVKDWSRQQGEGGAKGQAEQSREIVWACLEMLELGEGDMMEELDQKLTRDVLLV